MKIKRSGKLSLGMLVDKPYPHPALKDRKEISARCFQLSLVAFDLYSELVEKQDFELASKLLNSAKSVRGKVDFSFSAESKAEYIKRLSAAMNNLLELRYWIKTLQMKYLLSGGSDRCAEMANEIIMVLNFMLEKTATGKYNIQVPHIN